MAAKELAAGDSATRFTGLAELYAKYRPSYPDEAIAYVLDRCGPSAGAVLVDVGSGTGISARLFAAHGLRVIGIEPNDEMRAQAAAEPASGAALAPEYRAGSAERTGLAAASADLVLAAQAFHWFRADEALHEFQRILKPGGWVVLIWNERDASDACTAAFGAIVGGTPEAAALESQRSQAGQVLLTHSLFVDAQRAVFRNAQVLDEQRLLGRAFSVSYAPREPARAAQYAEDLRRLFARFQRDGQVTLHYETAVYSARKL
jgi:SAM-dependent methyltransferase